MEWKSCSNSRYDVYISCRHNSIRFMRGVCKMIPDLNAFNYANVDLGYEGEELAKVRVSFSRDSNDSSYALRKSYKFNKKTDDELSFVQINSKKLCDLIFPALDRSGNTRVPAEVIDGCVLFDPILKSKETNMSGEPDESFPTDEIGDELPDYDSFDYDDDVISEIPYTYEDRQAMK